MDLLFFNFIESCSYDYHCVLTGRMDALKQHAEFWNERKIVSLAPSLAKQYAKVTVISTLQVVVTVKEVATSKCEMLMQRSSSFLGRFLAQH